MPPKMEPAPWQKNQFLHTVKSALEELDISHETMHTIVAASKIDEKLVQSNLMDGQKVSEADYYAWVDEHILPNAVFAPLILKRRLWIIMNHGPKGHSIHRDDLKAFEERIDTWIRRMWTRWFIQHMKHIRRNNKLPKYISAYQVQKKTQPHPTERSPSLAGTLNIPSRPTSPINDCRTGDVNTLSRSNSSTIRNHRFAPYPPLPSKTARSVI